MIDREDMLALTRRMTVKRTSMTRIAGGYMDSDGCIDGTFNIAFLKLSPADREKNLQIAKKVPFAETNQNLQEYKFLQENMQNDSLWRLLMGMRACGLKNDALMETFYEIPPHRWSFCSRSRKPCRPAPQSWPGRPCGPNWSEYR